MVVPRPRRLLVLSQKMLVCPVNPDAPSENWMWPTVPEAVPPAAAVCHDNPLAAEEEAVKTWPSVPTLNNPQPFIDELPTINPPVVVPSPWIEFNLLDRL